MSVKLRLAAAGQGHLDEKDEHGAAGTETMQPRSLLVLVLPTLLAACSSSDSGESAVRRGTFEAQHRFEVAVPEGSTNVRLWLPIPAKSDPDQRVLFLDVDSPVAHRTVTDTVGNEFLYVEANNLKPGPLVVTTRFGIERSEVRRSVDPAMTRPLTAEETQKFSADLQSTSQSVINDDVRAMAARAVGNERNPVRVGRLLYDAILNHVEYHVKDPKPDSQKTMQATGTGSSLKTYETCTGNCTDFHSLYAALTRSVGIPTREVYGSFFKGPLDGQDKDQSYHCWIEIYAPQIGWIPLDVAVGDLFVSDFRANEYSMPRVILTTADGYTGPDPYMVDYYYGNIEERRVVWHRGRDLVLNPRQAGAPLLWNATGYAEADGKPLKVARKLTYRSTSPRM